MPVTPLAKDSSPKQALFCPWGRSALSCCSGLFRPSASATWDRLSVSASLSSMWGTKTSWSLSVPSQPAKAFACLSSGPQRELLFFHMATTFPERFCFLGASLRLIFQRWVRGRTARTSAMAPRLFWTSFAWTWSCRQRENTVNWIENVLRNAENNFFLRSQKNMVQALQKACLNTACTSPSRLPLTEEQDVLGS